MTRILRIARAKAGDMARVLNADVPQLLRSGIVPSVWAARHLARDTRYGRGGRHVDSVV
ncbi:MAG: hypothetical protein HZA62_07505 [Rhodocyclales bacterium]|nr:hypothetical protein [Rhodocyclales bacterium]